MSLGVGRCLSLTVAYCCMVRGCASATSSSVAPMERGGGALMNIVNFFFFFSAMASPWSLSSSQLRALLLC